MGQGGPNCGQEVVPFWTGETGSGWSGRFVPVVARRLVPAVLGRPVSRGSCKQQQHTEASTAASISSSSSSYLLFEAVVRSLQGSDAFIELQKG